MFGQEVLRTFPVSALSDAEVVRRVRGGEVALFELLMRRHNQRLYRTVRGYLRDEAEVEEAMQDAYVEAYAHLADFKGTAAFSTWLLRIGINEALMRLRKKGHLHLVDLAPSEEEAMQNVRAESPSPEDRAASRELGELTEAAVDQLAPAYRTVFVLREIEGMSTREVADALGLEEDAVKQRLHRAKAQIQQALYDKVGPHLPGAFPFPATRCDRVVLGVLARIGGR